MKRVDEEMRKLIVYTTAFLLLALLIVPAAMAAELHIVSTAPGLIDVYADGAISREVTSSTPATATISVDGAAMTYNFWASGKPDGNSGSDVVTSTHYTITATQGVHSITVTITNPNGVKAKLAYSGQSTITVPAPLTPIPTPTPALDTTPPVITAPSDVTAEGNTLGGWSGVIGTATATDNADPSPKVTNNAPALFPLGVTTVTWTGTDASGNKASATQIVTVKDTTPPIVTAPAGITIEGNTAGGYSGSVGSATATDIVDASPKVTNDAPALFPLGVTTVTWAGTDATGNKASATQTVTVKDTTPPAVSAPATLTVLVNAPKSLLTGSSKDIVDANPSLKNDAPSVFPAGITTVTWTATDASGNKGTATTLVTANYNIVGSGFLTPINMDGANMLQLNSALPAKFQLTDYTGKYISTAVANLYSAKISGTTVGQYAPAISKGASNAGSLFRYDTTSNQYIFNVDTKTLSTGNYQIKAVLDSGQTIKVIISLK